MKKLVRLNLSGTTVPAKIEKARHNVLLMTGNPSFITPVPTLASITTAVNALETAYTNALGGGKVLTAIMHEKEAVLDNLLTLLGHYVEATANGVDSIILSAGMDIKGIGGRTASVFAVKQGAHAGELKLVTKYYPAHAYIWQMVADVLPDETAAATATTDPAHSWTQVGVSPQASFTVTGLTAGRKYWFRVASVGKDGQNPWSDPICKMVSE